jgi:hypothetical protein
MKSMAKTLARILAYIVAGVPAVIGVSFVVRFAFVTSDTEIDGAATAFLFGVVAIGAFAGPAVAIAVSNNGRKQAAIVLWMLAVLAVLANWSHTLGAIAHRGAGTEAATSKAKDDTAADRAALQRIEHQLASSMQFVPATQSAVDAARQAVASAERTRIAECGANNETRRTRCREREADEAAARKALAGVEANKAATDRSSSLDAEATTIRARLAKARPTPSTNALGEAIGRFLQVSAVTAATFQQAFVSAIVELLIAAALALPELLRHPELEPSARAMAANENSERISVIEPPKLRALPKPPVVLQPAVVAANDDSADDGIDPRPVIDFMKVRTKAAKGSRADWAEMYGEFIGWQEEQGDGSERPMTAHQFGAALRYICEKANIRTLTKEGRVYCLDRKVV